MAFFLGLFLSFNLFAIEGDFTFSGEMILRQQRKVEVIHRVQTEKYNELRDKGYICSPKMQFFRCVLFVKEMTWPKAKKIEPEILRVHFGPESAKEIITESEILLQYQMKQRVTVDGKPYKGVLYTETENLLKAQVGTDEMSESEYFLIGDEQVSYLQQPIVRHSRFSWDEYIVEMVLEKLEK